MLHENKPQLLTVPLASERNGDFTQDPALAPVCGVNGATNCLYNPYSTTGPDVKVSDPNLRKPVLIDVRTGSVTPLEWQAQKELRVPLKDGVMAVAAASYLDWAAVPETSADLQARLAGRVLTLAWNTYGKPDGLEIERSVNYGPWSVVGKIAGGQTTFQDTRVVEGHVTYRLRAYNSQGASAWSNPAWVDVKSNY